MIEGARDRATVSARCELLGRRGGVQGARFRTPRSKRFAFVVQRACVQPHLAEPCGPSNNARREVCDDAGRKAKGSSSLPRRLVSFTVPEL